MYRQFSKLLPIAFSLLVVLSLVLLASAQTPPSSTSKKSSTTTSCDGALDIVPTKAASFARKRRPGKDATKDNVKQATPAESKSSPKPPIR